MATPTVYVICDNNCRYEGMTREQILTAIIQAVNNGSIGNIDTGFITTIKTINDKPLKFFVGTQAEYEALTPAQTENLFALITNDTSREGFNTTLEQLLKDVEEAQENINNISNGYAKLSSTFEQTGTASTGYPIVQFDIGTILTYRAIYNSTIRVGDIITGDDNGTIALNDKMFAFNKGSSIGDYTFVTGKWRVCGMCGSTQINSQTYNYWIIQRVE
jgi:hypothetical protein